MIQLFLTKAVLGAVARHLITISGGALMADGLTDPAGMEMLTGGAVALSGVVWSLLNKKKRRG